MTNLVWSNKKAIVDLVSYQNKEALELLNAYKVPTLSQRVSGVKGKAFVNRLNAIRLSILPNIQYNTMVVICDNISEHDYYIRRYVTAGWKVKVFSDGDFECYYKLELTNKVLVRRYQSATLRISALKRRARTIDLTQAEIKELQDLYKTVERLVNKNHTCLINYASSVNENKEELKITKRQATEEYKYEHANLNQYFPEREELEQYAYEYAGALGWNFTTQISRRDGDYLKDRILGTFERLDYAGTFETQNPNTGDIYEVIPETRKTLQHSAFGAYKKLLGVPKDELIAFYEYLIELDEFGILEESLQPNYIWCKTCGHIHKLMDREKAQPTFILDGYGYESDTTDCAEMQDYETEYSMQDKKAYNKFLDDAEGITYCNHCNATYVYDTLVDPGYTELFHAETDEDSGEISSAQ